MAKLASVLESLDGVDEAIQEFYTEQEGVFVLQIDQFGKHPGAKALKKSLDALDKDKGKLAEEVTTLKARVEGLPEEFDAEAYATLKAQAEGKGGGVTDEQIAEIRDKVTAKVRKEFGDKHTAEITPLTEENEKLKGSLNRLVIDGGLTAAMDAADIDPKHKSMLLPYLKTRAKIRVEEDDGGAMKPVVETDMGPLALKDWIADFAGSDEGKPYVTKPTGPAPNGNNGIRGGSKTMTRAAYNALPPDQQRETALAASKGEMQIVDG